LTQVSHPKSSSMPVRSSKPGPASAGLLACGSKGILAILGCET
jgi:hypothetical protein